MRKVLFKKWIPQEYNVAPGGPREKVAGTGCYSEMDNHGFFHQWGLTCLESSDGNVSYTIAIVEQPAGNICEVVPENLKFVTDFPKLSFTE